MVQTTVLTSLTSPRGPPKWHLDQAAHAVLLAAAHRVIALTAREGWSEYLHTPDNILRSWWYCAATEVSQWRNPGDDFTLSPLNYDLIITTSAGEPSAEFGVSITITLFTGE